MCFGLSLLPLLHFFYDIVTINKHANFVDPVLSVRIGVGAYLPFQHQRSRTAPEVTHHT